MTPVGSPRDESASPADSSAPVAALAEVLLECRPELAGLVTGPVAQWPVRRWLMAQWAAVLRSEGSPRHVLFAAGPGFGKTVGAVQYGLAGAAEGWPVCGAFFRHGYATLEDPLGVTEYVSGQLARLLPGFSEAREASRLESGAGNPIHVEVTGDVSVTATQVSGKVVGVQVRAEAGRPVDRAWRCDIADPLAALHRAGTLPRTLIILDALDETSAATRLMLADGLTLLPEPVRVLMTARPGTVLPIGDAAASATVARMQADAPPASTDSAPFDEMAGHTALDADGGRLAADPGQQDAELIAAWASARLEQAAGSRAWAQRLGARIADAAERTFLVAAYLTNEVLNRMPAEELPAADAVELPTGGLAGVYDSFLTRTFGADTTKWRTLGRPVLGLLSVARGAGLTPAMISVASKLELTDVTDTLADCAAFVMGEATSDAPSATAWRIWHRSFADHLHASAMYQVRPWDWQLRLGTALLPVAHEATAATILDGDHRHRYAARSAVNDLLDASSDPEGVTVEPARTALASLVDAGGLLEALVLLAGPILSATQVERLVTIGPSEVPWQAVAQGIREQAHILHAPAVLSDGFLLGQLSLYAARSHDAALAAAVERWSAAASMLLTRWSTAVSSGDVVAMHAAGISAMACVDLAGDALCLIGGRDGWVRAWSSSTGSSAGTWRVPDHSPVSCLTAVSQGDNKDVDNVPDSDGAAMLAGVGTPTGSHVLRWRPDGTVSVLWKADDGPIAAALAVDLGTEGGNGRARNQFLLLTSHPTQVHCRSLVTGESVGHPRSLPMPVLALAPLALQRDDGGAPVAP